MRQSLGMSLSSRERVRGRGEQFGLYAEFSAEQAFSGNLKRLLKGFLHFNKVSMFAGMQDGNRQEHKR